MDRIERYRTRFTLIELLAVVALISLLMAIGVPAFSRMIRGSRVDECARNIKLGLEQAQMRAASERRYVAVIFPNGKDDDVDTTLRAYRLGGFRSAFVNKNGGNYDFVRWLDAEWRNAPNGAILTRIDTSEFTTSEGDVTGCTAKATDVLKGAKTDADERLKKVTGVKNDDGNAISVGENTSFVFTPYGGVVGGKKLYLLVSEAVVEGDNIKYPTAGTSGSNRTSNYKVLKINNLTGRVEFYDEDQE